MAFQKSWLDVGVLKLPGKGFSPSGGGWRGCATVGLGEHLGHGGGFEGELEVSKMGGGGGGQEPSAEVGCNEDEPLTPPGAGCNEDGRGSCSGLFLS